MSGPVFSVVILDASGNPISAQNPLPMGATVNVGDIEIGAVEIKNDTDDTRVKVGPGVAANALRVTLASDGPGIAALGANADAKVVTDTNGSISAYLRGLITFAANSLGAGTAAAAQRVTLASDGPGVAALGANADAKVVTDSNGSISAYLRGLITFAANSLGPGTAAAAHRVTMASDDPAVATLGATTGAKVITDANGTVQQYLRGLVSQWIAGTLVIGAGTNAIGSVQGRLVTKTDKSGTITSGGVAQTAIATNAARTGFEIQNQSTGNMWFSSTGAAVQGQPSILIPAGQMYESPSHGVAAGNVSIIGATTGQAFAAREW